MRRSPRTTRPRSPIPAWRAPIRKGDRIRISGNYANKDHAYYYAMTHAGFYFDYAEEPKGHCKPYIVGPAKKKVKDPTAGVPNRPWTMEDEYCGWGDAPACEKDEEKPAEDAFANQNVVHVANFRTCQATDRAQRRAERSHP